MEFEFVRDERNELLKRREITFILTFEGATPSRGSILGKLCALLDLDERHAVLDSLKTSFGKMELTGNVRVYDDEESRARTELKYLLDRGVPTEKSEA
ncbi:MAG: 30S ribosomal protein S24e [Methanomicrobiaceae archaeon]|uniref:Ssu ribosomal protein s24e n=1 Tax=hydrocarbon metagenome TaxID=938273 RepID=A0A0W8FK59_9ZZZZ|nr:30S ribosomal protein S24e [Methanomicrobiaceae archaeon]MDD5420349.1 30S ribosomal protein S24e [Methanomicrobiaceae archaeon]